jgi:hypothetical protein
MDPSLRSLAPREHDRIVELVKRTGCTAPNITTQCQVLKIIRDPKKYLELLEKIERAVAKQAGFNFVLRNIPESGPLRDTGVDTRIGYAEMRDTLEQFGTVHKLNIIKGAAYVTFDDPRPCHAKVNRMQMGPNILTSNVF